MNATNEWREFFNAYADKYDGECFTKNTEFEVDFMIREMGMKPGSSVLDIGCGTGRHTVGLAEKGMKVTGVDISESMLRMARKRSEQVGVKVDFIRSDATVYRATHKFDFAISICEGGLSLLGSEDDPLEHGFRIVRNIYLALKPGGKFLTTVLNACRIIRESNKDTIRSGRFDPLTLTEQYEMDVETPAGKRKIPVRERYFTATEIIRLLRHVGFKVDYICGGTAGAWEKKPLKLDEMELMALAHKDK